MLSALSAFLLGYLPTTLGSYFNGLELTAALANRDGEELALRVRRREQELGARGEQLAGKLRQIAELLATAAVDASPMMPATPAQYHSFCEQLFDAMQDKLRREPLLGALYLLGFILGDTWTTLNLSGLVSYFLAASPQEPFLNAQAAALAEELQKVQRQLAAASAHPLWSEAQRTAIQEAQAALAQAPELSVEPTQRLAALPGSLFAEPSRCFFLNESRSLSVMLAC